MLTNPADAYVQNFINTVDSSKVLTVRNVMSTPTCMIRRKDGAAIALRNMRFNGISSAYVVDEHMHFIGLITLDGALQVINNKASFDQVILHNVPVVQDVNTSVSDITQLSADTPFPLPVVDREGVFCGIITKASVLSSFVLNN